MTRSNGGVSPSRAVRNTAFFFALLTGLLLLTSCVTLSDPEASQEFRADVVSVVKDGETAGQTFISRRPGLDSIQVWPRLAAPSSQPQGSLTMKLYHSPQDAQPLLTFRLSFDEVASYSPVHLGFAALKDPPGQAYYLTFTPAGGEVELLGRQEDSYPDGQFYLDGKAQEADIGFRLGYDYGLAAVVGDLDQAVRRLWLALPLLAVLWLPGWLLQQLLAPGLIPDSGARLALANGLSLAVIPLVMLWSSVLGLHWNRMALLALFLLLALASAGLLGRRWTRRRRAGQSGPGISLDWGGAALLAIFVFSLGVRLAMVRDMAGPAWVDSVHHAVVTRLILEHGAFPASYAPYLQMNTASYHAGFHSLLAVFEWLSALPMLDGMLFFGQVLNTCGVLAAYLLAYALLGDRRAGLAAALIAGVFTPMPAYMTSWGRYTQLAGILILPSAVALIGLLQQGGGLSLRRRPDRSTAILVGLAALACAGLFLTHYRVIAFLAAYLLAALLVEGGRDLRVESSQALRRLLRSAGLYLLVALLAVLVTLPWWPATVRTLVLPKLVWTPAMAVFASDFSWSYLTSGLGNYTLALAAAGLVLGAARRQAVPIALFLWVVIMFALANLGVLHLPGAGFINNTSVEITLFLPLAALGGYALSWGIGQVQGRLPQDWKPVFYANLGAAALILSFYAAQQILPILNSATMQIRQADRPALEWAAQHLPQEAVVLINPFAWGYGLYAGSDGGAWVAPIGGRQTLPPPVLYSFDSDLEAIQRNAELSRKVMSLNTDPDGLYAFLKEQGIEYIFLGARGGALSPKLLASSPKYEVLYAQRGVWIFRVKE